MKVLLIQIFCLFFIKKNVSETMKRGDTPLDNKSLVLNLNQENEENRQAQNYSLSDAEELQNEINNLQFPIQPNESAQPNQVIQSNQIVQIQPASSTNVAANIERIVNVENNNNENNVIIPSQNPVVNNNVEEMFANISQINPAQSILNANHNQLANVVNAINQNQQELEDPLHALARNLQNIVTVNSNNLSSIHNSQSFMSLLTTSGLFWGITAVAVVIGGMLWLYRRNLDLTELYEENLKIQREQIALQNERLNALNARISAMNSNLNSLMQPDPNGRRPIESRWFWVWSWFTGLGFINSFRSFFKWLRFWKRR